RSQRLRAGPAAPLSPYTTLFRSHQPRGLRVPLVPAHQHAEAADAGVDRFEAEVAGSEVELLVEARVVRDVHLAVLAGGGSVGIRSEEHTSELQSRENLVCRLLLE